jgi:hypothetical protein
MSKLPILAEVSFSQRGRGEFEQRRESVRAAMREYSKFGMKLS